MKFVTRTAAIGASLNAWFLLAFIHFLAQHDDLRKEIPFITRLLTEQAAEKVFRAVRAVLGGENFTLAEFFRRCDRIAALSILRALHEGIDFDFPECKSAFRWDEALASDKAAHPLPDSASTSLTAAIKAAKLAVIADMLALGVDVYKLGSSHHHFDANGAEEELDDDKEEQQQPAEFSLPDTSETAAIQQQLQLVGEPSSVRTCLHLSLCIYFLARPQQSHGTGLTWCVFVPLFGSLTKIFFSTDSTNISTAESAMFCCSPGVKQLEQHAARQIRHVLARRHAIHCLQGACIRCP